MGILGGRQDEAGAVKQPPGPDPEDEVKSEDDNSTEEDADLVEYYLGQVDFERLEVDPPTTAEEAAAILQAKGSVTSSDEQTALRHLIDQLP